MQKKANCNSEMLTEEKRLYFINCRGHSIALEPNSSPPPPSHPSPFLSRMMHFPIGPVPWCRCGSLKSVVSKEHELKKMVL